MRRSLVVGIVAMLFAVLTMATGCGSKVEPHRHELIAVSSDQVSEGGGGFLFASRVENQDRIYFYAVMHDGSIQMGWRDASYVKIFEDVKPGETAYLYDRYEFHVPKGTIVRKTEVPLPGQ